MPEHLYREAQRTALIAFATWLLEGEHGEGSESQLVDQFLAEVDAVRDGTSTGGAFSQAAARAAIASTGAMRLAEQFGISVARIHNVVADERSPDFSHHR